MATSSFIIRCKTEDGTFTIDNVSNESSVKELKSCLSKKLHVEPECIKILCGYPPKPLTSDVDHRTLNEVNIYSGETLIVEKMKVEIRNEGSMLKNEPHSDLETGIMMRYVVPSNNSCLFASVHFALSSGETSSEKSDELRKIIAQVVRSNPEKYNTAFLGMTNLDYCAWIQNVDHWGGAIELSILSEHFKLEIMAVDTLSLKVHCFGESDDYSNRIFLIYDGIHYDPLVLELGGAIQTIFPTSDDVPLEMAMELAREAKSSRQYTDVANFTLKCLTCNESLCGDKEARDHAKLTGHVDFGEITK